MGTSLRQKLDQLASAFASGVLDAIRSASIEDLVGQSASSRPRPATRRIAAPVPAPVRAGRRSGGGKRAGAGKRAGGRLARRSANDIAEVTERMLGLLKGSPQGLRAEEIRQKLGLKANEMPRPLKEAVRSGRLGKSGRKRATTYFLKAVAAGPAASAGAGGAPVAASPAPAAVKTPRVARARKAAKPRATRTRAGRAKAQKSPKTRQKK